MEVVTSAASLTMPLASSILSQLRPTAINKQMALMQGAMR